MPKHTKKGPTFERDERGNKERFLEYCLLYLSSFVEINCRWIIVNHIHDEELTESGFKGRSDVRFDRPGSVDYWIKWWVEEEGVKEPKLSYTDFISGLDYE